MNLTLFKGAATDLIHAFAEKTPLSFYKVSPGELIADAHDICSSIRCVVSGRVEVEHPIFAGKLSIFETIGEGVIIGLNHLYGLDTHFCCNYRAADSCGIMEFDKANFIQLIQNNNLILVNYLNYLSLHAQKPINILRDTNPRTPSLFLPALLGVLTCRNAENITIVSHDLPIADFLHNTFGINDDVLEKMIERGAVSLKSDSRLVVNDIDVLFFF
ncbi:MAG: cyclic nucleotide-binding domain-containing protein [Lepagella sp.]